MLEPTRHTVDTPDPCRTGEHNLKFQNFHDISMKSGIPWLADLLASMGPIGSGTPPEADPMRFWSSPERVSPN